MKITRNQLKNILAYDPNTGVFTWNIGVKGSKGKGKEAGTITTKGYRDVCIYGRKYGLHRLAFLFMLGEVPTCVDHINGIKSDNRWNNLRPATYSQNGYNYKGTGTKTGFKNVYYDPRGNKKFMVAIVVDGKRKSLGYYHTADEAAIIAKQARNKYHGAFSHD